MIDIDLKGIEPTFLSKAKKKGYICPQCGSGSGANGTGIIKDTKDKAGTHYKCFACGLYGDVIDLLGVSEGLTDPKDKFARFRELYGIDYKITQNHTETPRGKAAAAEPSKEEPAKDYTAFFLQAAKDNDFIYLQGRGISEATQRHFCIGLCKAWKHETKYPENTIATPRVIIPRSKESYLARFAGSMEELKKYSDKMNDLKINNAGGEIALFNEKALKAQEPVFIVEGEIDAMSIYEAGGNACGLCSTSNYKKVIDYAKQAGASESVFILMLDNDKAGQKTQETLEEELKQAGAKVLIAQYPFKDPNEYLINDREGMKQLVFSLKVKAAETAGYSEYNAADLLTYFEHIEEQKTGIEAKTGFKLLDYNLCGGLHAGLYIIGAVSSLGKTSFTLQLADQIAGSGQDVLFFSLEMSKYELMAKSISRYTFDVSFGRRTASGYYMAKDTMQILNPRRYSAYSLEERNVIKQAIERYREQAKNLYIYEGRFNGERLTAKAISNIVDRHIKKTGKAPVVFIDYLQIIAPADVRATDKQNTDSAVYELKEISRVYGVPVVAISSFNRSAYDSSKPVSMDAFKESGAIEYTADVLFGLQFSGCRKGEKAEELQIRIDKAKQDKEPVEVDLKCLKQRTGYTFTLTYSFIHAYNHFMEVDKTPAQIPADTTKRARI